MAIIEKESVCKGISDKLLKTTNGCGSSYQLFQIFRIPKWFSFEQQCACNCHDITYQTKKTLKDKQIGDDKLYDDMYYVAFHTENKLKKYLMLQIADLTYKLLSTKASEICFMKATVIQKK